MEISLDDLKKVAEISGMIGYKEGFGVAFKAIKDVYEKVPNADIKLVLKILEDNFKDTLKESGTDVTYDDIKFLNSFGFKNV